MAVPHSNETDVIFPACSFVLHGSSLYCSNRWSISSVGVSHPPVRGSSSESQRTIVEASSLSTSNRLTFSERFPNVERCRKSQAMLSSTSQNQAGEKLLSARFFTLSAGWRPAPPPPVFWTGHYPQYGTRGGRHSYAAPFRLFFLPSLLRPRLRAPVGSSINGASGRNFPGNFNSLLNVSEENPSYAVRNT